MIDMITLDEVKKQIGRLHDQMHYIRHKPKIDKRQKEYDKKHRKEKLLRDRERHAFNRLTEMRGLCHICFTSNVRVVLKKGYVLCEGCVKQFEE